jgi:hypothetical protein
VLSLGHWPHLHSRVSPLAGLSSFTLIQIPLGHDVLLIFSINYVEMVPKDFIMVFDTVLFYPTTTNVMET